MGPVPLAVDLHVRPRAVAHGVILLVEHLGVVTLPPLAFAVGLGQLAVIIHARLGTVDIIALGRLIPRPRMIGMKRDAQGQSGFLGGTGPAVEDIALGTDVLRVPGLVLRVPQVVVVVVVAENEEILRPTALVLLDECLGIPAFGLEQRQDILEAELRRMAVVLQMILVFAGAFDIERTGHPVATALHALRSPMGPDAELRITKPLGCLMGFQRLPCRTVLARLHRLVDFADGYLIGL